MCILNIQLDRQLVDSILTGVLICLCHLLQVIVATFGPGALVDVVAGVQQECDAQGVRLLQRYLEAKQIMRTVQQASVRKRQTTGPATEAALDHRSGQLYVNAVMNRTQASAAAGVGSIQAP